MPFRRGRRRIVARGGAKRSTHWVHTTQNTLIGGAAARAMNSGQLLLTDTDYDDSVGFREPSGATLLRIRGAMSITGPNSAALPVVATALLGVAIVHCDVDEAFALAGNGDFLATPTEGHKNDILWMTILSGALTTLDTREYIIDVKAKRKMRDSEIRLVLITGVLGAGVVAQFRVTTQFRCLIAMGASQ